MKIHRNPLPLLAVSATVAAILAQSTLTLAAEASTDSSGDAQSQGLDAVVVTGTRTRGRTVEDSAAPIDVIGAQDVLNTGGASLLEALNRLLPSLNLPANNQPDLGSIVRGAQLRNLDPDFTLVLINGKRRHTTSNVETDGFPGSVATDLAMIPVSAIDHIEVLRDGASAIYGSDAIAGVINIVLKSSPSAGDYSVQWGQTYKADGSVTNLHANQGFALGSSGFLNLSAETNQQAQAVRNFALQPTYLLYPAIGANGQPVALGPNNSLPAGATPNPAEATRNNTPWQNNGQPKFFTWSLAENAGYNFSDDLQAYAFSTVSRRLAFTAENFRTPAAIFNNNPDALDVYPNGFTPYESTSELDFQSNIGIKGAAAGWNWDLSTGFGEDHLNVYTRNTLNYSLTYPGSPTDFYDGQNIYSDSTTNLDITRSFDTGVLAKPLDIAFGAEYRHEHAELNPGDQYSYYGQGASSLPGYTPADAADTTRGSEALYLEASTNITSAWFVDAAVRGEHYSDFGSAVTGKFSTRYDVNDRLGFRATINNGFHAPSLITESYTNLADHNQVPFGTFQPNSAAALALGATPLQPERSVNYSAGITFQPIEGVHAAIDAYLINISHRLGVSPSVGVYSQGVTLGSPGAIPLDGAGNALTPAQSAQLQGLLNSAGILSQYPYGIVATYFTDVGDTRTTGVDFTLDGASHVGPGELRWNFAANWDHNEMTRIAPIPTVLQGLPDIGTISDSARYDLLYQAPTDKEILNLSYDLGGWTFTARENRYGRLIRLNTNTDTSYDLHPVFTTDVSVTRVLLHGLSLTLAVDNLFNKYPQQVPTAARSASSLAQYVGQWDNSGPLGLLGGTYYARLEYKF